MQYEYNYSEFRLLFGHNLSEIRKLSTHIDVPLYEAQDYDSKKHIGVDMKVTQELIAVTEGIKRILNWADIEPNSYEVVKFKLYFLELYKLATSKSYEKLLSSITLKKIPSFTQYIKNKSSIMEKKQGIKTIAMKHEELSDIMVMLDIFSQWLGNLNCESIFSSISNMYDMKEALVTQNFKDADNYLGKFLIIIQTHIIDKLSQTVPKIQE